MNIGTRTILFGYHQIFIHFFFVIWAWIKIFGVGSLVVDPKMVVAIFIHDLGYWGCDNLDGKEGKQHPIRMANWAKKYLGTKYDYEILFHSRSMSDGKVLSRLGMADKLAFLLYPKWLTKLLQYMSGEVHEYLKMFGEETGLFFFGAFYYWASTKNVDTLARFKFFQTSKMRDWLSNHKTVGNYYRSKYVTTSKISG